LIDINMKIFAFSASLSVIALPLAVAGHQDFSSPALETLGLGTLIAALSDVKRRGVTVDPSRNLRQLQFTEACNNTYKELWSDPDLNDAYDMYAPNVDAALSDAIANLDTCTESGNNIICDMGAALDGEAELKSACTSAGGAFDASRLDIGCSMTLDGTDYSIYIDLPDGLDCFPTGSEFEDCNDSLDDTFDSLLEFLEVQLETSFSDEGFTNVICDVGDVNKPAASSAPRSLGTMGVVTAAAIGALLLA
jgi:hypothetical protein